MRLMLIGEHPIATRPLKLLSSQHTGCDVHDPLLKPMAARGEQVKPTATSGATMTPTSPTIRSRTDWLALVTELQHWTGPLLQELLMPEGCPLLAPYTGVAPRLRRTGGKGFKPNAKRLALVFRATSEDVAETAVAKVARQQRQW